MRSQLPSPVEYAVTIIYLTTLYQMQMLFGFELHHRMFSFGQVERNEDETVVVYFKAIRAHRNSRGRTEENYG
jgi:hypothetical protein